MELSSFLWGVANLFPPGKEASVLFLPSSEHPLPYAPPPSSQGSVPLLYCPEAFFLGSLEPKRQGRVIQHPPLFLSARLFWAKLSAGRGKWLRDYVQLPVGNSLPLFLPDYWSNSIFKSSLLKLPLLGVCQIWRAKGVCRWQILSLSDLCFFIPAAFQHVGEKSFQGWGKERTGRALMGLSAPPGAFQSQFPQPCSLLLEYQNFCSSSQMDSAHNGALVHPADWT